MHAAVISLQNVNSKFLYDCLILSKWKASIGQTDGRGAGLPKRTASQNRYRAAQQLFCHHEVAFSFLGDRKQRPAVDRLILWEQ